MELLRTISFLEAPHTTASSYSNSGSHYLPLRCMGCYHKTRCHELCRLLL